MAEDIKTRIVVIREPVKVKTDLSIKDTLKEFPFEGFSKHSATADVKVTFTEPAKPVSDSELEQSGCAIWDELSDRWLKLSEGSVDKDDFTFDFLIIRHKDYELVDARLCKSAIPTEVSNSEIVIEGKFETGTGIDVFAALVLVELQMKDSTIPQ